MVGKSLSHYKIEAELGRGGMGIVYRAMDTKLDRTVAIKVLPSAALASEDDRARFYREAKAAAQLHHPHIASVFEIDEAVPSDAPHGTEPSPFIAMEFIDGETLDEKVKKGPLKLDEAIKIASQVASGLEVAHEKDIVHRDLKSQNVMITAKGQAKILDFGLAQTAASTKLTQLGSTLGTVAYMSPEQAQGAAVDGRTDLWSLGVVLYELIAGVSPFPGEYDKAIIYGILNQDPEPLTALRTGVPMGLEWIVSKCLAKKAEDRYQNATDLLVDLRNVDISSSGMSRISTSALTATVSRGQTKLNKYIVTAIAAGTLLIGFLGRGLISSQPAQKPTFSQLIVPGADFRYPDISDDGRYLVFPGSNDVMLYTYDFQTGELHGLRTEASVMVSKISPNGSRLAYMVNETLKIVPLLGNRPIALNPASADVGFIWVDDTHIVHSDINYRRLLMVNVDDVTVTEIAAVDSSNALARIAALDLLPDGRILASSSVDAKNYDLIAVDLNSGVQTIVMKDDAFFARYVSSGHLLYSPDGHQLMGRRFNPSSLALTGPTVELYPTTFERSFAVSKNGRFVILDEEHWGSRELVRVDRNGRAHVIGAPKLDYEEVSVDASSSRVVVEVNHFESREDQAVIIDLNNPDRIQQITFGVGGAYEPIWTSDGEKIMFAGTSDSTLGPGTRIFTINSSGVGERKTIISEPENIGFTALSSDNKLVAYTDAAAPLGRFVGIYSIEAQQEVRRWAEPGISYGFPEFSPDDRFIVFNRAAGEIINIWISKTDTEYSRPVTTNGGEMPKFSADGKFLYYYRDKALYELPVDLTEDFRIAGSEKLIYSADAHFYFDVIPDGSGFILTQSLGEDPYGVVTVIDGFFELLQDRFE